MGKGRESTNEKFCLFVLFLHEKNGFQKHHTRSTQSNRRMAPQYLNRAKKEGARERKKREGKKRERKKKKRNRERVSLSLSRSPREARERERRRALATSLSVHPRPFLSLRSPPHRVADHAGPRRALALHRPQSDLFLQLPVRRERRDRVARAVVEEPGLGEDAEAREAEEGRW